MVPSRLAGIALLALSLVPIACRKAERAAEGTPPVILISIDTLRADRLPAYGYGKIETPAIDRLVSDGILFENAYAHVPLTLPSHVTMMTGTLPYQTGVRSNIGYSFDGKATPSLPRILSERGYATGGAISAYVLRGDTGIGPLFDWYDDSLEVYASATLGALQRSGNETVRSALGWMDKAGPKPFFLFLHLFEPHTPYEPAESFRGRYSDPYDGEIVSTDAILGSFFDELDRRGIYDDAMIILVSDHGEGLGDHGELEHGVLLYREVLHIPMIVKLPGKRLAGKRVAAPAQLIDLLPTIAAETGARPPSGLPGSSLVALAEGTVEGDRQVYSETLYPRLHLGWNELRSLTDSRHHYIESPSPELFDIRVDAAEKNNLRESMRRESFALSGRLSEIPLNLVAPGAADPEERARLAALGYLSGGSSESEGPRRNPREHIRVLARVQETFVLNQQGKYAESVELCRAILRDYPELVDVRNQMAGNLRRLGRLDEALEAYREAIRRSPQLVDSIAVEVGKLEMDMGNLDAAELNAKQAMKLNPAEAHLLLAGVAMERRDLPLAEKEARLALGKDDKPRVPALIMLARILSAENKLPEALATVDRAAARISEDRIPPVATLESTRGDILARLGREQEAEAAFRREIQTFPTTRLAYVRLAILLASQKRFGEIEPTLQSMVKASPYPAAYALAAQVMSDLGNETLARNYRRQGMEMAERRRRAAPPS